MGANESFFGLRKEGVEGCGDFMHLEGNLPGDNDRAKVSWVWGP